MDVIFWNSDHPQAANIYRYIGPYKLAYWIQKYGYESQVIDYIVHMTEEQLYLATTKYITADTMVLAISTTFLCNHTYTWSNGVKSNTPEHVLRVLYKIKQQFNKIKIVVGGYMSDGVHFGGLPDVTIMTYTGSNEDIFLEYLNHLRTGSPPPMGQLQTKYLGMKGKKSKIRMLLNKSRNNLYNIEEDDFKWRKNDVILDGESLPLDVSRGCIFACRFCQYPHLGKGKFDYVRGMQHIKEELLYNYENFGTINYMVLDDTFNDTETKVKYFHEMVQSLPFKISFTSYIRADLLDRFPDMPYMLKESGLFGVVHGLESLHPYASNLLGKAWSGKKAREYIPHLFHNIWNSQVAQQLNFIIGLPKETKEDIVNTVNWAKDNHLYGINLNILGIHPLDYEDNTYSITSEFERNPEKYGLFFDQSNEWYNETWKFRDALNFKNQMAYYAKECGLEKVNAWNFGNMLQLGYTKQDILTTPLYKFDPNVIKKMNEDKYFEYYTKLMAA